MKVPNMSKWSLKEVNAWANFANIEIVMKGSGFVKAQSIAPNTTVTDGMVLTVELE
ncbi:MAG: PASTA domain-containing protein [Erysipelothrix sp.]|nr:PASTA domain-containing protein [Erysipelothrix sp.]